MNDALNTTWTPSPAQLNWLTSKGFEVEQGCYTRKYQNKYGGKVEQVCVVADKTINGPLHPDNNVWNVYITANGGTSCQTPTLGATTLRIAMERALRLLNTYAA